MILTERLTINGQVKDLAGYSIKTPTGGLGQSVTIALVEPELSLIPENASIKFEIGAGKADTGGTVNYAWVTIIDGGRLNGLSYSAGWVDSPSGGSPNDVIEFTAMSPLADRLGLAPKIPVIMFDPKKVEGDKLIPEQTQLIRTPTGYLTPTLISMENLSLKQVLDYAYKKCGFHRIVTNLPDYKFDRVDFTLESGYHSPALALYNIFEPVIFEDADTLYIISPQYGLPPGFEPQALSPLCVLELNRQTETAALVNAVILSYSQDASGGYGTAGEIPSVVIYNDEPQESGEGVSYIRTESSREVTEFKDINTGELRRIQENWVETNTFAYRPYRNISEDEGGNTIVTVDLSNGEVVKVLSERISNRYSGNTKSGHTRTVEALYLDPTGAGAPYAYGLVSQEECSLTWRPDLSHAGEYELTSSRTYVNGLCLVENIDVEGSPITNNPDGTPTDNPITTPVKYTQKVYTAILDAVDTSLVTGDGTQELDNRPLYTILETLRETGQNQSNIETRVINHLTGSARPPQVQSRTGSKSTYLPPYTVKFSGGVKAGQIRELITDTNSIAAFGMRKAQTVDVGKLDPVEGRKIAKYKLKLGGSSPRVFNINLSGH